MASILTSSSRASRESSGRESAQLRRGITTGACAAAAAAAAYEGWLSGRFPDPVTIRFPDGKDHSFALTRTHHDRDSHGHDTWTAGVLKDAGDDPDVTHGCEVVVDLRPGPHNKGLLLRAGDGVGTVTKPGLPLAVGAPAITAGPRAMIRNALLAVAARHDGAPVSATGEPNIMVSISIPEGDKLAQKTLNHRLGIVGGLSILGSTGRVTPYSCAAWIHAVHRGVDVAQAAGHTHLGAATGKTSETLLRRMTQLPEEACIDMGDFVGALLKYLRKKPVQHLTISGGFAKLSKLADGAMDLHSSRSQVNIDRLARHVIALGGDPKAAHAASSAGALLAQAEAAGLPLADQVATRARTSVRAVLSGGTHVHVYVTNRHGDLVGQAGGTQVT